VALIAGAGLAAPAAADITVEGTVNYDKTVQMRERLEKTKRVNLNVVLTITGRTASQANAIINQRIGDGPNPDNPNDQLEGSNTATYNGAGTTCAVCVGQSGRPLADFSAEVDGSIRDNNGITQYNQDVGWASNQNNVISAALGRGSVFAEANASVAQYNQGNTITETGRLISVTGAPDPAARIRQALMTNSVVNNTGVTQVNQNAGVFNNQSNSLAAGIGLTNLLGVAISESDLGQWNSNQNTREFRTSRVAGMSGSVVDNTGVVMGNQAAGHMANQANVMSLSASVNVLGGPAVISSFVNSLPPGVF
jgi:hypothetical protein